MILITKPAVLESTFIDLLKKYRHYYWASAWAGIGSKPFKLLCEVPEKIQQIVIGIHFYQTHPDFIKTFNEHPNVKYMMQPDGTFHPKLYLFENSATDWALLTGSGNFTDSAFSDNSEVSMLVNYDGKNDEIYKTARGYVDYAFRAACDFNKGLEDYTERWKLWRKRRKGLVGEFGSHAKKMEAPHQIPIMNWNWEKFVSEIYAKERHSVPERINMLKQVHDWLSSKAHFRQLGEEERKFIAGAPNKTPLTSWGYFGSMKGNGTFVGQVRKNNAYLSAALDIIPFHGPISKTEYNKYIATFQKAFDGTFFDDANNIATATRLLTMKRPDTFVCYDKENKKGLCKAFHLKQTKMDFDSYWEDIICRVRECIWYLSDPPQDGEQLEIWKRRAAFLDSLYYLNPVAALK